MKFENDFFKINIEKKELTEEQKEARRLRRKKRRPVIVIASILTAVIIGGVVFSRLQTSDAVQQATAEPIDRINEDNNQNGGEDETAVLSEQGEAEQQATAEAYGEIEGEYVTTSKLATGLQEKYADRSLYNYTYADPITEVGRDEAITFQLGYDVDDLNVDKWAEVFAIYQDPELTQNLGVKYSFDEETKTFIMEPSETYTVCQITATGLPIDVVDRYPHNERNLFDYGAGTSWGNLGTAYLASYRDKETGELLEKPEVSIVTFAGEIEETPKLTYSITDDGRPRFSWSEVEGAEEYMVCQVTMTQEDGYESGMKVLAITEDTSWITDPPVYDMYMKANEEFKTFIMSQDSWKSEIGYESNLETFGEPDIPYYYYPDSEYRTEEGICVIAVNSQGTSMISNVFRNMELAANLPYELATYTEKENGFVPFAQTYESVEKLPIYDYVTMCDGYTTKKLIDYQIEDAYIQDKRFMLVDEETMEVTGAETTACLMVPYRVEGTPFRDEFTVSDYDVADMEEDLAFLQDREDKLQKKSGDISPEFSLKFATHEDLKPVRIRKVNTEVVANSALSEYLATNMLGGVASIDLSEFPEAADEELVDDAFMEAYYQNPLILGIKGYLILGNGSRIRVVYEESLESQAQKQQAIQDKVTEIINEIITEDMTQQEKELAINRYLCDTIVYDEEAFAEAEANDFAYVSDEFNDAFNAYGALINGKSVCAGYAAAFHLLAQEAGLESVVVTGFMDGGLSHAWNKVKIEDEWQIVDVTNNDNEYFYNALLNLPSAVGDRILVEDKEYIMDSLIAEYVGETDENEYYHIMDNYFPTQEIAEKLSAELAENGEAMLRTDYELNDSQFYEITDAVYDIMGDDIDLYGYYWLGVIYLTMEA